VNTTDDQNGGEAKNGSPAWIKAAGMGSELAGSIVGGVLLGYWIDWKFGTKPTWILVGALIGIVGGFYNFIRRAYKASVQSSGQRVSRRTSRDEEASGENAGRKG
jgi:F0F1-type ATP synthase assembly protein I